MAYHVIFSGDATDDFDRIADYIAQDSPVRAISFINELQRRTMDTLGAFPLGGSKHKGTTLFLSLSGYIVLYEVDYAAKTVSVLRIVSGKTDWKKP